MKKVWKIVLIVLGVIILIAAIYGGYDGYKKSKTIKEFMPISEGGGGKCNFICIEDGYENGCFVPSEPRCDCNAGEIENYRYCEEIK